MRGRKLLWPVGAALLLAVLGLAFSAPAGSPMLYDFQVLHGFVYGSPTDGYGPEGPVVLDKKGNLYGTTIGGGANEYGTVFELTPGVDGQWTETILYNFPSGPGDGFQPTGVVIDSAGNLYGMTTHGGLNDAGTIFELSLGANGQWTESILWNFCSLSNCADGAEPIAAPTLGPGGDLYGTADETAFELVSGSSGWSFNVLYTSQAWLVSSLTLDARGDLYGETALTMDNGGTAFELQPQPGGQWQETVLHTFDGFKDGTAVGGGVTLHDHALYGTTEGGGNGCLGGCGTVFELMRNPAATGIHEQILWAFGENEAQGISPLGGVVSNARDDLVGATAEGGSPSCECGVVYGMKPQADSKWEFAALHAFIGSDGAFPNYGLTIDIKGNLYGTTLGGGPDGGGVVFELSPMQTSSK